MNSRQNKTLFGDFIDDVLEVLMIDAIFEGIGSILILIFEGL